MSIFSWFRECWLSQCSEFHFGSLSVWWHEYQHPLGAYQLRHGQQCWYFVHAELPFWHADSGEMMHFHARRTLFAKCWAEFLLQCMTKSTRHACFITDCGRAGLLSGCINFLLIWDFLDVPFSTFMNLAELNSLVERQVSFFKQLLSQSIWWHAANYLVTNERVFQRPKFTSVCQDLQCCDKILNMFRCLLKPGVEFVSFNDHISQWVAQFAKF